MFIVGFSAEVSERLSLPFAVVRLALFFVTMWKGLYGPPSAEEAGKATLLQVVLSLWWEQGISIGGAVHRRPVFSFESIL